MFARIGDPIEVAFDGRGWLYLGLPGGDEGITFLGGSSSGGRSVFSFKALETGRYTLRFQLQDNAAGGRREEVVALRVVSGQEFEEFQARLVAAAGPQSAAEAAPADPQRVAAADRLFSLGEYGQAVAAYLEGYREGDPYVNDRIGASYAATGDHLAAVKYYRKNLGTPEPFSSRAAAGLVRAAVATADTPLLLEQLPALLQGEEAGPELLAVGRWQVAAGRYSLAQEVLREYVRRYPFGRGLEEAWFLLAQILEAQSPLRDLQAARDLYDRVYQQFPESPLAVRAQARRDYLDRHFFQIR